MTPNRFTPSMIDGITDALRQLYRSLPESAKDAGREWYPSAKAWCQVLAAEYGLPVHVVAGVVAALSPMMNWGQNLELARKAVVSFVYNRPVGGHYQHQCAQAEDILAGEDPLTVLTGPKTNAFYRAIMGEQVPVIDRWSWRIAGQTNRPGGMSRCQYHAIEGAYYRAADAEHVPAAEFQAALWVDARERERTAEVPF